MLKKHKALGGFGLLLLVTAVTQPANAVSITQTGTLAADNSVYTYDFSVTIPQTYIFSTTSYGGGANLNGTTSAAGGFVPVLTLFSASSGNVVAFDGADGACAGTDRIDSTTKICDDAYIKTNLSAGNYVLDLTEFPNVAVGNMSSGFLFSSDPTATGDTCGGSATGHMFVEADLSTCPQRTDAYALNVSSVPEPATFWLAVPAFLLLLFRSRFSHFKPSRDR